MPTVMAGGVLDFGCLQWAALYLLQERDGRLGCSGRTVRVGSPSSPSESLLTQVTCLLGCLSVSIAVCCAALRAALVSEVVKFR